MTKEESRIQTHIKFSVQTIDLKNDRLSAHTWHPSTDLYETDEAFIAMIEIAGVNPENINISIDRGIVMVTGQRKLNSSQGSCHQIEIPCGEFSSIVRIPQSIDTERVEAFYEKGLLHIILPKSKQVKIDIS